MGSRALAAAVACATMVGAVGFTGCDDGDDCGDTVYVRVMPDVDFGEFETFAIADVEDLGGQGGAGGESANIPDDVRTNLDRANAEAAYQLGLIGLEKVSPDDSPDLLIVSAGASSDESGVVWECVPGWYWWGWSYVYDSCAWLEPIPVEYSVGTMIVALVDPTTNKVVFGGLAQGLLECGNGEERVMEVVDEIFDSYPVSGN